MQGSDEEMVSALSVDDAVIRNWYGDIPRSFIPPAPHAEMKAPPVGTEQVYRVAIAKDHVFPTSIRSIRPQFMTAPNAYTVAFGELTAPGLARGQGIIARDGVTGRREFWEDIVRAEPQEDGNFYNFTYFPVVYSNGAQTNCAMFMSCYASFEPTPEMVGHRPMWSTYKLQGNASCLIDVSTIADNNATLSLMSAIEMTRPRPGSYIWLARAFMRKDVDSVPIADPPRIAGASFGLSLAACIMGGSPIAYTGFVKKMPSGFLDNNYDNDQDTSGFSLVKADIVKMGPVSREGQYGRGAQIEAVKAMHVNDIVEEVQMLPIKIAFCKANRFPLVIPHKSTYNQSLDKLLKSLSESKRSPYAAFLQSVYGDIARMYGTVQVDQGIQFATANTTVLLATTLGNAIQLSAIAFIQYTTGTLSSSALKNIYVGASGWQMRHNAQRASQQERSREMSRFYHDSDPAAIQAYDERAKVASAKMKDSVNRKLTKAKDVQKKGLGRLGARTAQAKKKQAVLTQRKKDYPLTERRKAGLQKAAAKRAINLQKKPIVKRNFDPDKRSSRSLGVIAGGPLEGRQMYAGTATKRARMPSAYELMNADAFAPRVSQPVTPEPETVSGVKAMRGNAAMSGRPRDNEEAGAAFAEGEDL